MGSLTRIVLCTRIGDLSEDTKSTPRETNNLPDDAWEGEHVCVYISHLAQETRAFTALGVSVPNGST
jgi:hypothetical protein